MIGALCTDVNALDQNHAACSSDELRDARKLILQNFESVVNAKREFFPTVEELEAHTCTFLGEPSTVFVQRVSGKAVGKARLGNDFDLAMSVWKENLRVVVIHTDEINTDRAATFAIVPGERDKSRAVCVVLHKEHFDVCVLRSPNSVQAVFQIGTEWDSALQTFLSFIRTRLSSSNTLVPRWSARDTEKEGESEKKVREKKGRATKEKSESESEQDYIASIRCLSVAVVGGSGGDDALSGTQTNIRRNTRLRVRSVTTASKTFDGGSLLSPIAL